MCSVPVKSVVFTVPLSPISVNHYKKPIILRTSNGPVRSYARTPEADAYLQAVAIFARGQSLIPATQKERDKVRYRVEIVIVLGEKQRLDIDNGMKVILDGLQRAGVIHSDARIQEMNVKMVWDERHNPRTEIGVMVV